MPRNKSAKPRSRRPTRKEVLAALKTESDHHLTGLIERRLAMPLEKRMNLLRKRLPGSGSCL